MTELQPAPFSWGEISLSETVHIDGIPHFTRLAMGEWLEYADPQNGIDVVLGRNSYIDGHAVPVRLTGADGKMYDTKVYHPIGFLLTVMESGQPKAQSMKVAVAKFVWHFAGPRKLSHKDHLDYQKQITDIAMKLERATNPFVIQVLLGRLHDMSLAIGVAMPDIRLLNAGDDRQQHLRGV